ncbi:MULTISPECIES: hypothetical protein [unclassified Streptomyces]|uniref:hypothetical protein n=1 Tax=unclassified Streptomyces TaxID=2593676 RepID=UPI002E18F252|nr:MULTISPECIES: hypothetical protein [unclassified Streptomyces]
MRAGPGEEEAYRVRVAGLARFVGFRGQGAQVQDVFVAQAERLTCGEQNPQPGRALEQALDHANALLVYGVEVVEQ